MHLKDYHRIQWNLFTLRILYYRLIWNEWLCELHNHFYLNFKSHFSQIQFKCWKDKCFTPTYCVDGNKDNRINFLRLKNVVSRFSMAKIKWWCKCYWWLSWKETNLFMVVYSPLFQCSLQSCWTGIQFLGFINHSQKWPPHGSIYSAFCVRGKLQFGAFLTKNMI